MNAVWLVLLNLLLVALAWTKAALAYPGLSEAIPLGFDAFGAPISWGSRSAIYWNPMVQTMVTASALVLAKHPSIFRLSRRSLRRLPADLRAPIHRNFSEMFLALGLAANMLLFLLHMAFLQAAEDRQMMLPLLHLTAFSILWIATAIFYLLRHKRRLEAAQREAGERVAA